VEAYTSSYAWLDDADIALLAVSRSVASIARLLAWRCRTCSVLSVTAYLWLAGWVSYGHAWYMRRYGGIAQANYYREKMHVDVYDEAFRLEQARTYVTGLQWVLSYYYHGVVSWSWFYPSHYAPFVTDVHGIEDYVP